MKKTISIFLSFVLLILCFPLSVFAKEELPPMQTEIKAKAAVLMDMDSGKVLMAQNANEPLPPASITKIMTLLLVAEAIDAGKISRTDVVQTSKNASLMGGSQVWLKEGETMTVDELLKATAVYSANDASTALAEYVGGSTDAFVMRMNEKAEELGMVDTHFENCTGLDDTTTNHVTTAYDIALMSKALLEHEWIKEYTTIWMDTLRNGETQLVNTNKLIHGFEGATGLKTGTTSKAGCCVSATAQRDGLRLIAVVLGSENSKDRFDSARAMLNWGFSNFVGVDLTVDKSLITNVHVLKGKEDVIMPKIPESVHITVPKGEENNIQQVVDLAVDVLAPVEKEQVLGKVQFKLGDTVLYVCNLVSAQAIEPLRIFDIFCRLIYAIS